MPMKWAGVHGKVDIFKYLLEKVKEKGFIKPNGEITDGKEGGSIEDILTWIARSEGSENDKNYVDKFTKIVEDVTGQEWESKISKN